LDAESACRAALWAAAVGAFEPAAGGALERGEFWRHCLAVALAAEDASRRGALDVPPLLAFACGLLHDVGKLALDAAVPKSYQRVLAAAAGPKADIARAEREILGVDHALVGREVARHWRLARRIEEVIWLHHHPLEGQMPDLADAALIGLVQLADAIARERRLGFSGNRVFSLSSVHLAELVGLSAADASAVADALPDRLARALELFRQASAGGRAAGPGDDEQVRPAGGEGAVAGPVGEEADAAGLVEVLRRFVGRLGPGAAPERLCGEIARAYAALFAAADEPGPVCAFCLSADEGQVLLSAYGHDGAMVFRRSSCRPVTPPDGRAVPAGPLLRALLDPPDAWSDLLDPDRYVCLPLWGAAGWVGGVLVAAGREDRQAELKAAFCELAGFVLAARLGRRQADRLAEQLERSTQRLAEARRALARAQAFAAIGEMAAGAAHELNNPLAVISGRAQLIAASAADEQQRRAAEQIILKAEEISRIADELLEFAEPTPPVPAAVAVAELLGPLREGPSEAQSKAPAARVDIHIAADCPPVWVDAGQLRAVLRELLDNAVQAAGGAVDVRIEASAGPGAGRVRIRVSDAGPGMDDEVRAMAFTPFFSHKPAGRRRGMGLPKARRYVQANGGEMWIESRPGPGTTVVLELPAARGDVSG